MIFNNSKMLKLTFGLAVVGALTMLPIAGGADSPDPNPGRAKTVADEGPVTVELVSDTSTAAVGEPFNIGVRIKVAPEWHVYAPWPGNTGDPVRIRFELDERISSVDNLQFPMPKPFDVDNRELTAFGYVDESLMVAEAVVIEKPASGQVEFGAEVRWLACKEKCVSGSKMLHLSVAVGETRVPSTLAGDFGRAASQIPKPVDAADGHLVSVTYNGGVWDLTWVLPGFVAVDGFMPRWIQGGDCIVDSWTTSGKADGGTGALTVKVRMRGTECLPFAGGYFSGTQKGTDGVVTSNGTVAQAGHADQADQAGGATPATVDNSARTPGFWLLKSVSDPAADPWRVTDETGATVKGDVAKVPEMTDTSTSGDQTAVTAPAPAPAFSWYFLLLAFAGGLLLNVMPCVIPVIIPKVTHLARTAVRFEDMHERRRMLLLNGLAYTAGIMVAMIGFACVVVALKAAGQQVGWGFQFQSPLFLAIMTAVLLAMAFGMFGVFPLDSPAHADQLRSLRAIRRQGLILESFMTGLLVTFLGTPCTAPLLGPAVGFAFLAGTAQIFAFFGALAVGFALPFLMLAVFPGWTNRLQNFKVTSEGNKWAKGLAFLLIATMIWLLGVLAGGYGLEAVDRLLWFLLIVAVACWMYGVRSHLFGTATEEKLAKKEAAIMKEGGADRAELVKKVEQARHDAFHAVRKQRIVTAAPLIAIVILAGSWILQFDETQAVGTQQEKGLIAWEKWSQKAVDDARAQGKTVFVDVTAAWCMNCKSNERLILNTQDVADMFKASGVIPMKADYTRHDPAISALLEQHKRVGVPVYLVYPPCTGDPVLLPEILTTQMVEDALKTTGPSLPGGCPKP